MRSRGCGATFVSPGYDIPNVCGGDIGPEYCPYCSKKKTDKVKQGKKNRLKGATFERKVRKLLEERDWTVDKWTNNIKDDKLVPAGTSRFNTRSCGFPDFVCFKGNAGYYQVEAVECKTRKYLNKEEKAKVQWYLDNKIFSRIYVAYDDDGKIKFIEMKGGKDKDGK